MRNTSDTNCVECQNTHFMFHSLFLPRSCRLRDTAGQATDENIIRRMRIACWLPKFTNSQSEYATLITVALQQWLHKQAPSLRYTHIVCLVH
jgi:hypothetical protein